MSADGSTQQIVLSKYILQWDYFVPYRLHKAYDARIRTLLEETENRSLKYPKTKDDYIGLVKLVADDSPDDFWGESTDVLMDRIRRKYMDGEPEAWEEFQAVLDKCLEYGRFRDIRLLGRMVMELWVRDNRRRHCGEWFTFFSQCVLSFYLY